MKVAPTVDLLVEVNNRKAKPSAGKCLCEEISGDVWNSLTAIWARG